MWVTGPHFAVGRISQLLAARCRPCLNETSPEVVLLAQPGGSYQFLCLPRPKDANLPAEARSTPGIRGGGSYALF
jgi:hypothetical protein